MASPLFDLTGRVAVVTGSSKGIGKPINLHLALEGAKIEVSSRKAPVCEETAAEIRKAGGHATVIPCNISQKAQCENLVAETRRQLGPVDVLVCNAATNPYSYGPTEKMPDDVFMKIMQNNEKRLVTAPLCRIGEPDDIGGIAVMLAGKAGIFITGQTIIADGGMTIGG